MELVKCFYFQRHCMCWGEIHKSTSCTSKLQGTRDFLSYRWSGVMSVCFGGSRKECVCIMEPWIRNTDPSPHALPQLVLLWWIWSDWLKFKFISGQCPEQKSHSCHILQPCSLAECVPWRVGFAFHRGVSREGLPKLPLRILQQRNLVLFLNQASPLVLGNL